MSLSQTGIAFEKDDDAIETEDELKVESINFYDLILLYSVT
jgi:hypothetical protein